MIRLIDFGMIYKNFNLYFKDKMAEMNEDLKSCNIDPLDPKAKVACTSIPPKSAVRGEVTRANILNYLKNAVNTSCVTGSSRATNNWKEMNDLLRNLDCVPLSWVNSVPAGKTVDPPTCQDF